MTVKHVSSFFVFPFIIGILFIFFHDFDVTSLIMLIVGLFMWNVFEYSFHRVAFHGSAIPKKLKRYLTNGHRFHHRYPDKIDNLILPVSLTLPFSLISLFVVYSIFGEVNISWYYLGLVIGLYSYEFMHYAAHHMKIKLKFFKYMKHRHLSHHFKNPKTKFMVSNPLFDYLLGTK